MIRFKVHKVMKLIARVHQSLCGGISFIQTVKWYLKNTDKEKQSFDISIPQAGQ